MKPETRLSVAREQVALAEAAVARQRLLLADVKALGHPAEGAKMLLRFLEGRLAEARKELASIESAASGE